MTAPVPASLPNLEVRLQFETLLADVSARLVKARPDALMAHAWPGNIRELRNVLERAMILTAGPVLDVEVAGGAAATTASQPSRNLQDVEREHILDVLRQASWRIRGKHGAAAILGLKPTTLEYRMARLAISRPGTHEPNL